MKKISESPKHKIERLNQELIPLKEERNKLNLEAKKCADKRNALHNEVKSLRKEAANIKEKRDAVNEQVQELKKLRDEAKNRRKEKRDRTLELKEKLRGLTKKRPEGNLRHIEREIEKIDWKIQTTSLPVKEEENLINQVRQLEAQLLVQKQIKKVKEELLELRTKERNLGIEAKTLHEKLAELAEQSQRFHEKMLGTLDKARNLQVEADNIHQKYLETKQQAQKLHQKSVEHQEKIRAYEGELKETADKRQAERESELQKELEERALTKLKRGEKLMWEEFKILAEKGLV
ncbi:MAG: hypothetical protein JSW14_07070 [Candidatus Bathyarchaeum sp.]|nr:MAG: hypothetical protein JSW14_07070 [Candidatus Bathyarchaeum sp.]